MGSLATIFLSFDEMPGFISGTAQHPLTHARAFIHRIIEPTSISNLYPPPDSTAHASSVHRGCVLEVDILWPRWVTLISVKVDKRKRFIANPV